MTGCGRFTVERVQDGKVISRIEVTAGSDVEAARMAGPVKVPTGREPNSGEWLRVTQVSRISWFRVVQ